GGICASLVQAFLDGLGSAVNEVLGFLQAQAGDFAYSLNHGNLVGADFGQNNGELGLLFSSSSASATSGGCSNSHGGRSRRHTEFFFHFFDQLGQLKHGHAGDCVEDFSFGSHFVELQMKTISRLGIVL